MINTKCRINVTSGRGEGGMQLGKGFGSISNVLFIKLGDAYIGYSRHFCVSEKSHDI